MEERAMLEEIISKQNPEKLEAVATIIINFNLVKKQISVAGHIDNTLMALQMLNEAGHIIINRNSLKEAPTEGKPN